MSGFAFSHQFSKRWLATPTPVKHAIIQELDDIVTLLQPDTDLEQYQFSVPNLHDKVEELLAIERAHQEKLQAEARLRQLEEQQRLEAERLEQTKREAERLAQERLAAQQLAAQQLEAERQEQERLENAQLQPESAHAHEEQAHLEDAQRLQRERQAQDEAAIAALEQERAIARQAHLVKQARLAQQAIESSTSSITLAADNTDAATVTIERHSSDMVYAIDSTAAPIAPVSSNDNHAGSQDTTIDNAATEHSAATTPDIETIKQDIVKQLQGYIDNYLLESMTLMNDDLNKWLKTEVETQLKIRLSQSH